MKKATYLFALIAILFSANLFAQRTSDIEDSKDYPMVSRYKDAIIEYYKEFDWDTYKIPLSKVDQFSDVHFPKTLDVEGKIIRIQYSVNPENTPVLIFKNYKDAFTKAGYKILFEGVGDHELGNNPHEFCWYFYGEDGLNLKRFGAAYNPAGTKHAYIVAQTKKDDKNIYIVIYISNFSDATIITQDIIEEDTPEIGLVTAELIDKGISESGHIALNGVYFDTGRSSIRSESKEALKNIAQYLKNHPNRKFLIVGHTDNTGNMEANFKLSLDRAQAVMNELIQNFNIDPTQLKAFGNGSTSPVASNATEAGRTKNRRVEIVKQ